MELHPASTSTVKHGRADGRSTRTPTSSRSSTETFGVFVYQEQVHGARAQRLAGFTLPASRRDLRKAMGKKIAEVMLSERERFIGGAIGKGYDERLAEQLFDLIEPFAGYAFNKAHAFSYAVIAYRTAWLKAHYPVEFMTAVLMAAGAHPTGAQDRIAGAIAECARLGIEVLAPDINASGQNFAIASHGNGDGSGGAIRFGLAQIKNVGQGAVEGLLAVREEDGDFTSIEDFARRVDPRDCNRRVLESLAKAGALDPLLRSEEGEDRSAVVFGVDRILTVAQEALRQRETGQTSMFDLFGTEVDTPLPALELEAVRTPEREIGAWERELLGTYVSSHPFRQSARVLAQFVTHQTTELTADLAGQQAIVAGMVTGVRRLTTRQGKAFATVTVEDLGGTAELTVWPDRYEEQEHRLVQGNVLLAKVEVRERGDRLTVAVEELAPYDQERARPIEFDPSKFTVTRGARRRGRQRNGARPADGQNGRGPNGAGPGGPNGGGPGPQLRAVPTNGDVTANGAASNGGSPRGLPATPAHGPTRLFIAIEETTDVAADRRRIGRILRLIAEHPGDEPAELLVVAGDGTRTLLQLASVSDIDTLTAALRPLLGVLGRADRAGGAAEEAPRLAAVGG